MRITMILFLLVLIQGCLYSAGNPWSNNSVMGMAQSLASGFPNCWLCFPGPKTATPIPTFQLLNVEAPERVFLSVRPLNYTNPFLDLTHIPTPPSLFGVEVKGYWWDLLQSAPDRPTPTPTDQTPIIPIELETTNNKNQPYTSYLLYCFRWQRAKCQGLGGKIGWVRCRDLTLELPNVKACKTTEEPYFTSWIQSVRKGHRTHHSDLPTKPRPTDFPHPFDSPIHTFPRPGQKRKRSLEPMDEYDVDYDNYDFTFPPFPSVGPNPRLVTPPFPFEIPVTRGTNPLGEANTSLLRAPDTKAHLVCAPPGYLFYGLLSQPRRAIGLQCLDPRTCSGTWGLVQLSPHPERILALNQTSVESLWEQLPHRGTHSQEPHSRQKRVAVTLIVLGITALITALGELTYGVVANAVQVKNLTATTVEIAESTGSNFRDLHRSLDSLAGMVLEHRQIFDWTLASQGGVCAMFNGSCCMYINKSQQVETRTTVVLHKAKWLHYQGAVDEIPSQILSQIKAWTLSIKSWLLSLIAPLIFIIAICLFGSCTCNCLSRFISGYVNAIKMQIVLQMRPLIELPSSYQGPLHHPPDEHPPLLLSNAPPQQEVARTVIAQVPNCNWMGVSEQGLEGQGKGLGMDGQRDPLEKRNKTPS